jgi:UDP-N-acetylmuramoyl-tripeptide--D-alanyl-D-alanine ligase
MMHLSEIQDLLGAERRGDDAGFERISIDTRTLQPGDLYVAIRGTRFDGNDFVHAAQEAGASGSIVERWVECKLPQIRVADGRIALGQLASFWRQAWAGRLVGVTGSNGKTTVKELVAAILSQTRPILKTQGNLNNDIGVPLTLLKLRPEHSYAVIEMGANHRGEIAYVGGLAQPDVAVISNAGPAHLEGFGSLEGVARGKGELIESLKETGVAILNADDRFYGDWRTLAGHRFILDFGFCAEAAVRAVPESVRMGLREGRFFTDFEVSYRGDRVSMALPLIGRHNVTNALAAIASALALGLEMPSIQQGLARVVPVSGRLEPIEGRQGAWLINDTYNANPASFGAALEVLAGLPGEHWVALGAFSELGEDSAEWHAAIGRQARELGVVKLFAVGQDAEQTVRTFGPGAIYCANQDAMIERLEKELCGSATILVKGSRSQRMERVVQALCQRNEPCC